MKSSRIFSFAITLTALALLPVSSGLASTSLYADLSAIPNTGQAPLNNVSLAASVSGDATGLITYRFDCASDGAWDWIQTTAANPYTAVSICNYPTAGNYTATIKVERDSLAFQGTVAILASAQTIPPTVDLKANGSDGPITIPYNTSTTLSWTSTNATSCYGTDTGWQGYKSLSGSENTGNLLSAKTYILSCSGTGGTATDSVTAQVTGQTQTLYASLEAIPNSGNAPLNLVDLRATATGTATGLITYRFDCASDGVWDYTFISISDNPKTVIDACNYQNPGTYIPKVRIERGTANPAEATTTVIVSSSGTQDLSVAKLGRNLSDNTAYGEVTISDPGEVIEFRIFITATGSAALNDVIVKDTLPANMSYYGSLKVDNVLTGGDILTGLNIGILNSQQTKTITFQAVVAGTANFAFGATSLINTALVYNTSVSRTDTASVNVIKTEVLGVTDVPTGILDSAKIAFIFSVMATILLTYLLLLRFYVSNKAYAFGVNDVIFSIKEKLTMVLPKEPTERAEQRLTKIIEEIRKKEKDS